MVFDVGFDNDFPERAAMHGEDRVATFDRVFTESSRVREHGAEIELCEVAILHASIDVPRELELPMPPLWRIDRWCSHRAKVDVTR